MGIGVTAYFKMLKFLMFLFLWFSLISIPSFMFYYTGNDQTAENNSIKYILSAFSLGNVG